MSRAPLLPIVGGVLPVDKPPGPTSHDIVARARRALGTRKIGHTGTLDPFASGLLLLCVGPATRLSEYLLGLDKEYVATARLGVRTASHYPEGEVVATTEDWTGLTGEDVRGALQALTGALRQTPPAYSAKKVGGEAAHRIVRRGGSVELEPVEVTVHEMELLEMELPRMVVRIRCSSGTYVRAIARDLGDLLGVGAHLTALRRTRIGRRSVDEAVPGDRLDPALVSAAWIDPVDALGHLPRVDVGELDAHRLAAGQRIDASSAMESWAGPVAVVRNGDLVAIATLSGKSLRPRKVFTRP